MKLSFRIILAFVGFGQLNQISYAQTPTETDTIQFQYPLEVGNVWVYSYISHNSVSVCSSGCDYERWEVMENTESELKGHCAKIAAERIYDDYQGQISFELCMNQNRLYRYPGTFGGDYLRHGDIESELMVDFNQEFFDPFEVQVFGVLGKMEALKTRGFYNHVMTWRLTEFGDESGCDGFYSRCEHEYESELGFTRSRVGRRLQYPDWMRLKGSFLNGVLTGDTTFVVTTSIDNGLHPERGEGPHLLNNYPNPFNPSTVVSYRLSVFGEVQIHVMNLLGQRVATLFEGVQTPGQHSVTFDASGLPSGMYVIVLESEGRRDVRKVSLLK